MKRIGRALRAMHPAARDVGVAVVHEEAVAGIVGLVARPSLVPVPVEGPVRAIVDLVEQRAVALTDVHRLQNVHVEAVFDQPRGVARRLVEIDDAGVERGLRVGDGMRRPHEDFVRAGGSERLAAECGTPARDVESGDP